MAPATFSDLPPEMVGNVFAFVRQKVDQGSICLVSRAWRDSMAPMMWEKLETNLSIASPRSMATLLHQRSGVLSHVRDLIIYGTKDGQDRLKQIIAAIPRDRIRSLRTSFSLNALTWGLVISCQRKIEVLNTHSWLTNPGSSEVFDLDSAENREWTGPSLSEVSSIQLAIEPYGTRHQHIANDIKFISRHCPKVMDLCLLDGRYNSPGKSSMSLSALLSHARDSPLFPNLTTLRLYYLDVAKAGDLQPCRNFNLSKLRTLHIHGCNSLVPFLEGLSSFYTDDTGELYEFVISLEDLLDESARTIQAIERLLKICPKLQILQMDLSGHGLVAKDCVLAHCQTLTSLWINTATWGSSPFFSAEDMASILGACTRLERLAIDMPFLDVDHLPELEDGFRRNVDFAAMLTVISATPTLRALRILNIVEVDLDDDDFESKFPSSLHLALRKIPMQKLANHILRFMTKQGSDLRVLSFKHSYLDMKWEIEEKFRDRKGRQWPEYHYCCGRTTDITGTNDVMIAHRSKNIALEYPDLTRFLGHVF